MYILDTNVISELRKANKANKNVTAWAASIPSSALYLSVITFLELEIGTLLIERRDKKQGNVLRAWLTDHVLPTFSGRILPVDTTVAQHCAMLHVPQPRADRDALIAATAIAYGMTIVTRNVFDFKPMGVKLHNPWN